MMDRIRVDKDGRMWSVDDGEITIIGDVSNFSLLGEELFTVDDSGSVLLGGEEFTVNRLKQIIREVINESYGEQADYYAEPGRELGEQPVLSEGA